MLFDSFWSQSGVCCFPSKLKYYSIFVVVRARIKEACNLLRQLVPGMSEKTDKATVFEFAARYVHFLKSHTGAQHDKVISYIP